MANSRWNWIGLKKNLDYPAEVRRQWIERENPKLSIAQQCRFAGVARSSWYYQPAEEISEDRILMRLIDEQYLRTPFYGIRRMKAWLNEQGYWVNHKRVARLMRAMGLQAIYPKPKLSQGGKGHQIYPYLLRGVAVVRPDQIWSTDITYIRLRQGYVYLVAVMDWYSRYVLSWELSNTLDAGFCISALEWALGKRQPEIFNTDQGAQFTCQEFLRRLQEREIRISMDGRGRALDNAFVERLWRSVKWEEVYLKEYANVTEARKGLASYFRFYNWERLHQSLDYKTPAAIYYG